MRNMSAIGRTTQERETLARVPACSPVEDCNTVADVSKLGTDPFPKRRIGEQAGKVSKLEDSFSGLTHFRVFVTVGLLFLTVRLHADSPAVHGFKQFLSTNVPIRVLRYTQIDCATGNQRHYVAAIAGDAFFVREYNLTEDPRLPISEKNRPQSPNFVGRWDGKYWQINGFQITLCSPADPVPNSYKLSCEAMKRSLEEVLCFGVPLVNRGEFIWKRQMPDARRLIFEAPLRGNIRVVSRKTGMQLTNVTGYITVTNGFVAELRAMAGASHFEYATNMPVPLGIPTQIVIGKSVEECETIYRIEQLEYGDTWEMEDVFDPRRKFASTNITTIVVITNGNRLVLTQHGPVSPSNIRNTPASAIGGKTRWVVLGVLFTMTIIAPLGVFLFNRSNRGREC